ncbi:porin family protein [Vibrio neptunius]|uniref:porin family protein n=1 Tax=Vibrio neptunius TaxID=170651 RepID=UPI0019D10871|nr:porin family protein [Vibrio neptunius]MBN3573883.1 porin family protein [Vibrio neptunius]
MKKKLLAALVAAVSFQAVGAENVDAQQAERSYLNDGWYLGVDIIDTDFVTDGDGAKSNEVSSTSAAASLGYNFKVIEDFIVGIEAEFVDYGKFDLVYRSDPSIKANLDIYALSLNLKPKYFVSGSKFYLGALIGVGTYKTDLDAEVIINQSVEGRTNQSRSDTGFSYGAEMGYAINNNWFVNGGYRVTNVDVDGSDIDMDTLFLGIDYKF